ncbi:MAG: polysaccharide biosynthesis protein [Deltaproteobacteria bacterium]|nr:polysaccharide biosynthesis protein [Deltaproteobacteria bacterium]
MDRFIHKNLFLVFALDIILVVFAWYFAHLLRFNFSIPQGAVYNFQRVLPLILVIKILSFYLFDLYQGMWRYTSLTDLVNILKAGSAGSLVIILMILFVQGFTGFSRSIFIIDWFLTLFLISGNRVIIRLFFWLGVGDETARVRWRSFFNSLRGKHQQGKKLLIIGAGDCGEKICREIHDNSHLGYQVSGFIDDDPSKANLQIHGIPVLGNKNEIQYFAKQMDIEELLIASPSASSENMRNIVSRCEESGIPFKTVPGMGELIDGRVSIKAIRDVAYKDLLGRAPVNLDEERIGQYLHNKRVLITGAGGSIGSELCRQICRYTPEKVVLYERAESPLYEIELELREHFQYIGIVPRLADILDTIQLEKIFDEEKPHVVFHAAAYKHVPMLEINPWEAVSNNVIGTRNVIETARKFQVERFVLVSTDKAVRPANVMGASKRLAEILVQGQDGAGSSDTRFITVRFGNVVGSVGSVVPLFKKQIEKGGPVTVTHPEITRYFMTIPEACQLILQAGSMGNGGEVFILDMGTPVKISDMARDLIRLSGFEPDVDIKIEYIGLRPGEKMSEELITDGEDVIQTSHEKVMVLKGSVKKIDIINGKLDLLMKPVDEQDGEGIREILKDILPGYAPQTRDVT